MTNEEIKTIIDRWRPEYDKFRQHGTLKLGAQGLNELNQVHAVLFGRSVDLACGNCVIEMAMNIYRHGKAN
jgi:hypothetical protein